MKIYVAGPITGHADLNEPAFRDAQRLLESGGHEVVIPLDVKPLEHDGDCPESYGAPQSGHTSACYIRADLKALLDCDAIYCLKGWTTSVGAKLETNVAYRCGMTVYGYGHDEGLPPL